MAGLGVIRGQLPWDLFGISKVMKLNDTLWGLLLLLFGAAVAGYAWTFPAAAGHGIGPGVFPLLIGAGIAVAGIVFLGAGLKTARVPRLEWEAWVREPRTILNAALVVGSLVFYALAVQTIGFFVSAFVFLMVLFLAFGVRRGRALSIAVLSVAALHVAFYSLLRVPLPWGWLEALAW